MYDHTPSADQVLDSIRDVEQSVARMCELSQVDIRPQLPALFTKLVRQMRALDARALNQLYSSTTSAPCEKAKYVSYVHFHASSNCKFPFCSTQFLLQGLLATYSYFSLRTLATV